MNSLAEAFQSYSEMNSGVPANSYYNENEKLYYCSTCNTAKQCRIKWMGIEQTVNCMCDCETRANIKDVEAHMERKHKLRIRTNRNIGIPGKLFDKTFENFEVSESNRKNYQICRKYCDKFAEMKADNIGLRLCGSNGTGKTHMAAAMANRLIEGGWKVYMRTMDELIAEIMKSYDKNETVSDICSYDLLIIDEFGQERSTETVQQYVQDIINTRVINGRPFIITTNIITPNENEMNMCDRRIYSRFNETLMTVPFEGKDMRAEIHNKKLERFKEILKG